MLKSWSIENFKPIVNSGELKLAPVTVLAGRNSSGKSSLLQSILMIAQTLSNQLPERALLPNGPLVQLGTFEDILNDNTNSSTLTIGFDLEISLPASLRVKHLDVTSAKFIAKFNNPMSDSNSSSAIEASQVFVESAILELKVNEEFKLDYNVFKISDTDLESYLANVPPQYFSLAHTIIGTQTPYSGKILKHNQPHSSSYLTILSHFLPLVLFNPDYLQSLLDGPNTLIYSVNEDENQIRESVLQITRIFTSKIRYLGPLRADPTSAQQSFAPSSQLDEVGAKGEYAAVVYHYNQLADIEWYNPNTRQVEHGILQNALDAWSQHLGVAEQVRTEMSGSMGIAWKLVLKKGQKARTLPEVGVGLSQVLPILVQPRRNNTGV